MSALAELSDLIGKWQGTNRLWLSPEDPVRKSESFAEIRNIAHDQFTKISYSWAYEGKPQEGMLILGQETESKVVNAVWFDTWHMIAQFMVCNGPLRPMEQSALKVIMRHRPDPIGDGKLLLSRREKTLFAF